MIEGLAQAFEGDLRLIGVEMGDLTLGVYAGVGSAGTDDGDGMTDDGGEGGGEGFLDGGDSAAGFGGRAFVGLGRASWRCQPW